MAVGAITTLNLNPALGGSSTSEPGAAHIDGLSLVHYTVVPTTGANYASGGVPITAAQLGLRQCLGGFASAITQAATVGPGEISVLPQSDGSIKLKCGAASGVADNAANADLSATLVDLWVLGY